MINISAHARQRYAERIEPCSLDEARDRILLHAHAIEAAAAFGAEVVRLGTGARLILDGLTVVTCYSKGDLPRQCRARWAGDAL